MEMTNGHTCEQKIKYFLNNNIKIEKRKNLIYIYE